MGRLALCVAVVVLAGVGRVEAAIYTFTRIALCPIRVVRPGR